MNLLDNLWLSQAQNIVGIFQIDGVILEQLAAVVSLGRPLPHNQRTHRSVENEDSVFEQITQRVLS